MVSEESIIELVQRSDFLQLPIGVYVVALDGHFIECNWPVRKMLGLPEEGRVKASIADFYADPKKRQELLDKADEADNKGWHFEKEIIHFQVEGREVYAENFCKPQRDPVSREIIGYVGCLVDVTEEHKVKRQQEELKRKVDELAFDIGRILHSNTSVLLMTKQTLDGAAEALRADADDLAATSPKQADKMLIPKEMEDALAQGANQLADALERFVVKGDAERRLKALSQHKWDLLSSQIRKLRHFRENIPFAEMRPPTLRITAHEIADICREVQPHLLPKEPHRNALRAAVQLEKLTSFIAVQNTRVVVIQMDYSLKALREFVTADVREREPMNRLSIKQLLQEASNQMVEFAETAKVKIERLDQRIEAEVMGVERELVRALSNLLHNAIKYSWAREQKQPWVAIRTYRRDQTICIEFENWGVPISKRELEKKLIFDLGYRGKWSTDRGRVGTGIGLTDARRVIQSCGGDIDVNSRPAQNFAYATKDPDYYRQAFLTKVTVCLPIATSQ